MLARNVLNHLLLWDLRCFLLRLNNAFSALYPKLSQDEASVCCEPWLLLYPLLESLFWVAVGPCFVKVYTCILHLHASIHQLDFHLRALFQALQSILDGKTLTGEFLKPTDPEYASQATSLLFPSANCRGWESCICLCYELRSHFQVAPHGPHVLLLAELMNLLGLEVQCISAEEKTNY